MMNGALQLLTALLNSPTTVVRYCEGMNGGEKKKESEDWSTNPAPITKTARFALPMNLTTGRSI